MEEGNIVKPGDVLATSEEYLAGDGTYIDNGNLCAAVFGKVCFDREEMIARVVPEKRIALPKANDIVYGEIISINPQMLSVNLLKIEGEERELATREQGNLHVSNMTPGGKAKPHTIFKEMEIIRAKVIETEPSIQLSTNSPELGTLIAYCRRCRGLLVLKGGGLWCPECESKEDRKIAENYGLAYEPEPV